MNSYEDYTDRWLADGRDRAYRLTPDADFADRAEPDAKAMQDALEHDYPGEQALQWERTLRSQSLRELAGKAADDRMRGAEYERHRADEGRYRDFTGFARGGGIER